MKRTLTLSTACLLLLSGASLAQEVEPNTLRLDPRYNAPWGVGITMGMANNYGGTASEWGTGPLAGIVAMRALTYDTSVRYVTHVSGHMLENDANIWNIPGDSHLDPTSYDGTLVHQWHGISLQWAPRPQGALKPIQVSALFRGGAGLDIFRSHFDLAGVTGVTRVSSIEYSPGITGGIGASTSFYGKATLQVAVDLTGLFVFDRGERGGGDNLRGFITVTPVAELLARF
jgi:hypothetical protein